MKLNQFITAWLILPVMVIAQIYDNDRTPARIILNLTDQPSTSMAVTWRTIAEIDSPVVQFVPANDWTDLEVNASSALAVSESCMVDSLHSVFHHSLIMRDLNPGTLYAYRVGSEDEWSEWNHFRTAEATNSPFKFVFFGDPQVGVKDFVSRIFRTGFAHVPDARFWVFTGDLIPKPEEDRYWHEWFYAGDFIFAMVPSILTPGSHEYYYKKKDGTKVNEFTRFWDVHFTLPENGIEGLGERSYYVDYQGVRIIMLDGQSNREEQAEWMDQLLTGNPNNWTIAAVHQPVFSMGRERDEKDIHDAFMHVFDKHGVDLVLTGHDHVYARSHKLYNEEIVPMDKPGTVYVVSVSGAKSYPLNSNHAPLMAKTGQDLQLYQVLSVDGSKLSYKAFTVTGQLFDEFELTK